MMSDLLLKLSEMKTQLLFLCSRIRQLILACYSVDYFLPQSGGDTT